MTNIYLVRHAEAEGNMYRRAHGQMNGLIIGRGFAQIECLRKRFADTNIAAVYSSDLTRAMTTAAAVSEPRGYTIRTSELLREVRMGLWEDVCWGDLDCTSAEEYRLFNHDPENWLIEGAERFEEVQTRMVKAIREIARSYDGQTVAVFSHGFAIRAFMCHIMNIKSADISKVLYCDNTAVTLLHCENDDIKIEYYGDNSHLSNELSTFANQTWWRKSSGPAMENLRFVRYELGRDDKFLDAIVPRPQLCAESATCSDNPESPYCSVCADSAADDFSGAFTALMTSGPAGFLDFSETGRINCIYMLPELRRMGYGVQLLGQAVSCMRRKRIERLTAEVPADALWLPFFYKYGFTALESGEKTLVLEKNIKNW